MAIVNALAGLCVSTSFCWDHFIERDMKRCTWLSLLASCVLSILGWFDFVVVMFSGGSRSPSVGDTDSEDERAHVVAEDLP